MKKLIYTIYLLSSVLVWISCSNQKAHQIQSISSIPFDVDSTIPIRNIQNLNIVGDQLYITYDYAGGGVHQILRRYDINYKKRQLTFSKELLKDDNNRYSIYVPVVFWDNAGDMFVAEYSAPDIYLLRNDSLFKTSNALISAKAKVPYEMALEAKQAFYKSPNEYYFVGRQPMSGISAVYHADNRNNKLTITEKKRIICDERYSSWMLNAGTFSYNYSNNIGVYAFMLFPVIKIYDFANDNEKIIRFKADSTFNSSTTYEADVWETNHIQFKHLCTTDDYIFALYWGAMAVDMDRKRYNGTAKTKIVKCDLEGNILNIYVVNRGLQAFTISNDNTTAIAYDGKDFLLLRLE